MLTWFNGLVARAREPSCLDPRPQAHDQHRAIAFDSNDIASNLGGRTCVHSPCERIGHERETMRAAGAEFFWRPLCEARGSSCAPK